LFAIGVFGYVTATLASFFVDRDAAAPGASVANDGELRAIRRDLAAIRSSLEATKSGSSDEDGEDR
jgi:voltage-gated potassium channel